MFKAGDIVERTEAYASSEYPAGSIGYVIESTPYGGVRVRWAGITSLPQVYMVDDNRLKPATFPIPADKDPWRESEPDAGDDDESACGSHDHHLDLVCTRAVAHSGCHVARDDEGVVYSRWPNEASHHEAYEVSRFETIADCDEGYEASDTERPPPPPPLDMRKCYWCGTPAVELVHGDIPACETCVKRARGRRGE